MKNSLFLNEVYSRILRCRFSCAPSIQQLAGLTLLPGHNTASSNSFLKCLGCCNLEHLLLHHEFMVYTCFILFLFFLVLHVLDLLLLFFFSPENGGFAPVLFWTGCIYLRKLLVWHCIKWSCSKVHVPGLKQISRKQHPFNSFKVVTLKKFFRSWLRLQLGLNRCAFSIDFIHGNFATWSWPRLYLDFVLFDPGCYAVLWPDWSCSKRCDRCS